MNAPFSLAGLARLDRALQGARPGHLTSCPGEIRVDARTPADMTLELDAWRALSGRALEPNVFFEPEVLLPALQHLPDGRGVTLLCAWDGGRLVALAPVVLPRWPSTLGPRRHARLWQPGLLTCGVPLVDRDAPERTVAALLAFLHAEGFGLALAGLPGGGPFALALAAAIDGPGYRLATAPLTSWPALGPAAIGAAAEPRGLGSTESLKPFQVERARDSAGVRDAVEEFLALDAACRPDRPRQALVRNVGAASFARTMTRQLARDGRRCRVDVLRERRTGRAVAAAIVLRSGRTAWVWATAIDPAAGSEAERQLAVAVTRGQRDQTRLSITFGPDASCGAGGFAGLWPERTRVADVMVTSAWPSGTARRLWGWLTGSRRLDAPRPRSRLSLAQRGDGPTSHLLPQ